MTANPTRDIAVEVAYNVRHLGGFATATGSMTSNQLIRAGGLSRLTPAGIGTLRDGGLEAIVDLRSPKEQAQEATPDLSGAGIRIISAPVYQDELQPARYEGGWVTTAVAYQRLLAAGMGAFKTLFETIEDTNGAVLFHCTAGKDRTGVAAALLLDLAGVDREEIAADHARSAELLKSEFARFAVDMKDRGFEPYQIEQMLSSKAEDLAATLEYITERWGSSEGYLVDAGVSDQTLAAVRARVSPKRA